MWAWFNKLLGFSDDRERDIYEYKDRDFEAKIFDLRRRIEEQRARIGYHTPQSIVTRSNEQISSEAPIVDTAREKKNAELADLKAKLLGKKQ